MIRITDQISIDESELEESFVHVDLTRRETDLLKGF